MASSSLRHQDLLGRPPEVFVDGQLRDRHGCAHVLADEPAQDPLDRRAADLLVVPLRRRDPYVEPFGDPERDRAVQERDAEPLRQRWPYPASPGTEGG
jgi:hypothetical protein